MFKVEGGVFQMKLFSLICSGLFIVLSLAGTVHAQSATGQITGTVKDATGAVIAGVPVTISSQLTGITRTTKSNDAGAYSFPLMPVSVYSVTADQKGFRAAKRSDISLSVDQVIRVDLDLQVGEVTETVDVKASAVTIDTESAAVGQVVSQKQVTELPLNGRNFLQLLFLGNGAVDGVREGAGDLGAHQRSGCAGARDSAHSLPGASRPSCGRAACSTWWKWRCGQWKTSAGPTPVSSEA